ncbi:MAG: hypothetical protein C0501_22090 [Isosphaera sp.]|nr:hypothetical protein [Isosphaera sp.]
MKTCTRCHVTKPPDAFYPNPRRRDGRQGYCKACFNGYTTDRLRARKKQAVEYLGGRCADCAVTYPYYVYEFHHLDPTRKDVEFGTLRRRSWPRIKVELDKCVLLCANCHRTRHWQEFDAGPPA